MNNTLKEAEARVAELEACLKRIEAIYYGPGDAATRALLMWEQANHFGADETSAVEAPGQGESAPEREGETPKPPTNDVLADHVTMSAPFGDQDLLKKAIRYLNLHFPDASQWTEHHAEVQKLVDLMRPASAPDTDTPPGPQSAELLRKVVSIVESHYEMCLEDKFEFGPAHWLCGTLNAIAHLGIEVRPLTPGLKLIIEQKMNDIRQRQEEQSTSEAERCSYSTDRLGRCLLHLSHIGPHDYEFSDAHIRPRPNDVLPQARLIIRKAFDAPDAASMFSLLKEAMHMIETAPVPPTDYPKVEPDLLNLGWVPDGDDPAGKWKDRAAAYLFYHRDLDVRALAELLASVERDLRPETTLPEERERIAKELLYWADELTWSGRDKHPIGEEWLNNTGEEVATTTVRAIVKWLRSGAPTPETGGNADG